MFEPTNIFGCVASPKLQVVDDGHVTYCGSVKLVAVSGCDRSTSISRCANAKAVPSFRLFEFIITDVGTSCATATSPKITITVAISISVSVNPRSLLRRVGTLRRILVRVSYLCCCQNPVGSALQI